MITVETAGGASFRGAALYYLHDRRQPGEAERLTAARVAWTHVCNLPTQDPERAWRMMAHTAMAQSALKTASGIKASGRKLAKPVAAYSLSWHPDELPTREEMLGAAIDSLQALGVAGHQAIIAAHGDGPHPHVHVILNRVHGETGLAAKLGHSRRALSAWALAYEQGRGRVYCQERAVNDERRRGLRPGETVKRNTRISRRAYEATLGRQRQDEAIHLRADLAGRFADQAAAEHHQAQRRQSQITTFFRDRSEARAAIVERHAGLPVSERMAAILAGPQPETALMELTHQRSTFTRADLARLVARHTGAAEQFHAVMRRIEASADFLALGPDSSGRERFTTRPQRSLEQRMMQDARALHDRMRPEGETVSRAGSRSLSPDQQAALRHILSRRSLAAVTGYAGSGKSTMLDAARRSWEQAGLRVTGLTLSGIAADGLKTGAGIDSRTVHSRLYQWGQGQARLTSRDVVVVDEAGMLGSRLMAQILAHAAEAGAKVVLVGDAAQLQAIEAGGAFKAITDRHGAARLTAVRRQRQAWQQDATRDLADGQVAAALDRYEQAGMVHGHQSQADAMAALVEAWHRAGQARPADTQLILAYTRADVRALNELARVTRRADHALGPDKTIATEAGPRSFAVGDRLYFLKNDHGLKVRNGTLGTVERIAGTLMTVRLDGEDGRVVTFDAADYRHIDHGYAATIHKSQGVTVAQAHVLASQRFDRHLAYVAMSRHRDRVDLHWSIDTIGTRARLARIMGRDATKDTSLDYDRAGGRPVQATADAAEDLQSRIRTRAARFAAREKTVAGRVANARSLAGPDARPAVIARLAVDRRARLGLYRQQHAALRARAVLLRAKAAPMPQAKASPRGNAQPELIEFDARMAGQYGAIRQRHAVERRQERADRARLAAQAAPAWEKAQRQAAASLAIQAAENPAGNPAGNPAAAADAPRLPVPSGPTLH